MNALPIEQWDGLRVLTVREPWATLIVTGFKDIENRSRRFGHRGPLLIHASSTLTRSYYDYACELVRLSVEQKGVHVIYPEFDECKANCGKIIGGVELYDCARYSYGTDLFFKRLPFGNSPWHDKSPYALALRGAWQAVEPVAFKGQLCLGTFRKAVTP